MKPRLLDLYCGAGGTARGLQRAGFYVVGVDNRPQPHYCGDEFILGDALDVPLEGYDAYWASPPCQGYSIMHNLPWLRGKEYPTLIPVTLERLKATGKPYILENVMGARYGATGLRKRGLEAHGLQAGWLCGTMFGLPFYRHRLMATAFAWLAPTHPKHVSRIHPRHLLAGRAKAIVFPQPSLSQWQDGAQAEGVGMGHAKGWRKAAEAMGIDWMNRAELTQAIPPAYSEFMGLAMLRAMGLWRRG